MQSWEYMDTDEVWEVIWDAFQLQPLNELEIYWKWIPRFNQGFQELLKHHQEYIDRIVELISKPDTKSLKSDLAEMREGVRGVAKDIRSSKLLRINGDPFATRLEKMAKGE